ncbi:MAG: hypothetical protein A4E42_01224 [Methanoregulaceae archaeon PtaU1.Bin222]|nr:MAG: hypothetical protein A4E42_01224 [Methanoregulaceae archaeon PtaU1.Bin222]
MHIDLSSSQVLVEKILHLTGEALFLALAGRKGELLTGVLHDEHLGDESLEYICLVFIGDRVYLQCIQQIDELVFHRRHELLHTVHEGGIHGDVIIADIVLVEEYVYEDRVVCRVDEVGVGHRLEVTFQFREEEGDPVLVDRKKVEVFEQVWALFDVFFCIDREHPVECAALDIVHAVVVLGVLSRFKREVERCGEGCHLTPWPSIWG